MACGFTPRVAQGVAADGGPSSNPASSSGESARDLAAIEAARHVRDRTQRRAKRPRRWWEARRLKPLIAKVFPLPEASAALTALVSRRYAGKIVLET